MPPPLPSPPNGYSPFRRGWARRGGLVLLCSAAAASGVAAQEPDAAADDDELGFPAVVEVHLGVTTLADVSAGQIGAAALLDFGPVRVGGGAWEVLRRIDEGPLLSDSGLELTLGYGGALVEFPLGAAGPALRLLLGGGAATLRTRAINARLDTKTFAMVEPSANYTLAIVDHVAVGAELGYRWIRGADDLFLVGDGDLGGVQGSLFLRIGGR